MKDLTDEQNKIQKARDKLVKSAEGQHNRDLQTKLDRATIKIRIIDNGFIMSTIGSVEAFLSIDSLVSALKDRLGDES